MNECYTCGFWDSERSGCTCPHSDMWYACPVESELPENKKALEEYAEWQEKRTMTNREYMAHLLSDPDWIDDGGASYLSMVEYNINCPYFAGDERCHCRSMEKEPTRRECGQCKLEWLEAEVDE